MRKKEQREVRKLTMTSQLHLIERQPPFLSPQAQIPSPGQRSPVVLRMVRRVELFPRVRLEPLHAVPRHVLQRHQGAVGRQQEIQVPDPDDGVIRRFDHALQHAVLRGAQGLVAGRGSGVAVAEDVGVGALHPVCRRGVDGRLDVAAVEVHGCPRGEVVARVDDAELAPEERAGVEDVVDVEAGVDGDGGGVNVGEEVARVIFRGEGIGEDGEGTWGWGEGEIGVVVGGVVAFIGLVVDRFGEGGVQGEDIGPVVDVGYGSH